MVALHVCQVWWTLAYKPLRTRRHKSRRTLCQDRSVRACVHSVGMLCGHMPNSSIVNNVDYHAAIGGGQDPMPPLWTPLSLCATSYRNLVLQRLLRHHASLLRLRDADVADLLHVLGLHGRLGLHLLQLVLEMGDHLRALPHLRLLVALHLRNLPLQLAHPLPTVLLPKNAVQSRV